MLLKVYWNHKKYQKIKLIIFSNWQLMADKSRMEGKLRLIKTILPILLLQTALWKTFLKIKSWKMKIIKEGKDFHLKQDISKKFKNKKFRFHLKKIILKCLNLMEKNKAKIQRSFIAKIMIKRILIHRVHLIMQEFQNNTILNSNSKIRPFQQIYPQNSV